MARARTNRKAGTSSRARAERVRLFVEAYLQNGGNATQAAVAAGYAAGAGAEKAGYRLSKDVRVAAELKRRHAEVNDRAGLRTQAVVDVLTEKQRQQLGHLTPELEIAIVGFRFDPKTGNIVEVKFADKNAAVEKAMRHLGLFERDNLQRDVNPYAEILAMVSGQSRGLPAEASRRVRAERGAR